MRLEEITNIHAPVGRCFGLARSVEVHLAGQRHRAEAAARPALGLIGMGQRVTWRAKHFGFRHQLTSEIAAMERPEADC